VIQEQVTKIDIVTFALVWNIGNASEVDERVTCEDFLAKWSQGCSLAASEHVQLPEIATNVDFKLPCQIVQVRGLDSDMMLGLVENSMPMDRQ
jgi:hypothetical protein